MEIAQTLANWCQTQSIINELLPTVDSTNNRAKSELPSLSAGLKVYIAEEQSHGRGRGTNTWITPGKNKSILSSWVFKLSHPPQAITAPLIGLALYRSVKNCWPQLNWSVKPPNDLLLSEKKVAGILIEAVQQGDVNYLIIGLGFNILSHPEEISLATHLNSEIGLNQALQLKQMEDFYNSFNSNINEMIKKLTQVQITAEHCQELAVATGAKEVSPDGTLTYTDYTKSWKDL
ncbi:MAG: biotin--[acetyl-CoA-carboxylase] ligase [Bdellovibrionales bacterium]|nr:biotin--[acetyl-CoA-carboxylase] ligase [Bdellovibrionales bacterium]